MIRYTDYSASLIQEADFFKKIAYVAHNCYQVEGKSDDEEFIKRLLGFKHYAMIEHYLFSFKVEEDHYMQLLLLNNPYVVLDKSLKGDHLCTLSLRVLLENECEALNLLVSALPIKIKSLIDREVASIASNVSLIDIDDYKAEVDLYKRHKQVSVKIITDRGVSHELVRHRPCSFAQESTRYCNYLKNRFGNSITLMRPLDYDKYQEVFDSAYQAAEDNYFALLKAGSSPDVARALLPNGLKTSIIVSCSLKEWEHIFYLREAPAAHIDMRLTMKKVREALKEGGFILEQSND